MMRITEGFLSPRQTGWITEAGLQESVVGGKSRGLMFFLSVTHKCKQAHFRRDIQKSCSPCHFFVWYQSSVASVFKTIHLKDKQLDSSLV